MATGDKTILKRVLREQCLPALARHAAYFSVADVREWLRARNITCPPALLREYLSAFMRAQVIHDAGRGWYSRIAEPCALNKKSVDGLSKDVAEAFPLLDFTCWSTEQIANYGHLLLTRFVAFVHTERDAMSSVADRLGDRGYDIHLNPRGAAARKFAIRERTVVIRPKPTTQPHDGHLVTMEGLLVELFVEGRALRCMDEGEYCRMFDKLASSSRISMAGLLDYARERRPTGLELEKHIKADFLKKSALMGRGGNP
jgi:hypothetical protein